MPCARAIFDLNDISWISFALCTLSTIFKRRRAALCFVALAGFRGIERERGMQEPTNYVVVVVAQGEPTSQSQNSVRTMFCNEQELNWNAALLLLLHGTSTSTSTSSSYYYCCIPYTEEWHGIPQ